MNRSASIEYLQNTNEIWDMVIIGGGATGLGIALDAALRGYKTLLLEQADFTKGTSSRSTKLVHGGVRYLAQGDYKLVLEALHERGLLLKNAPHLTYNQTFVIPSYSIWDGLFYTMGLKLYDFMAGSLSLGKSEFISAKRVAELLPNIETKGLKNGIIYHDGQFDDARLGINLAQSCTELGGHVINYMKVTELNKDGSGKVNGVKATDLETNNTYSINARTVINATGIFVDTILSMNDPGKAATVRPSQGVHIVLDKSFLPGENALMIPKTSDGRVLFAIPWHDKVIVGTTDTLVKYAELEPKAKWDEIDFILSTFSNYSSKKPKRADILSIFAGLRPLAMPQQGSQKTKEISRSHKLFKSESGLVTITGGKWTTYRKMAEETVDLAIKTGNLPNKKCGTESYKIHGYTDKPTTDWLSVYGSYAKEITELMQSEPSLSEKIHSKYPFAKAEVVWAVRNEMGRTVEDVLARRTRLLFLDAQAASEAAPQVARIMSQELGMNQEWTKNQIIDFRKLTKFYR